MTFAVIWNPTKFEIWIVNVENLEIYEKNVQLQDRIEDSEISNTIYEIFSLSTSHNAALICSVA